MMPNKNGGTTATQDLSAATVKCVSLANGTLSPDLRVNYEFGLVLGVNEFRQEQMYFLEKEYLHNRALHGYGTVYGLRVTTSRPADNAHEVLVMVEPGMGIDQWGRVFILRQAQCARVGAWLAKQEQASPGITAKHTDASGNLRLCVVASYDECPDALVPVPGQPCSQVEKTQAASRIRDSFDIQFRWEPPEMPAWDAVQRFARLMANVRIEPNLPPAQSDEATIIALVRTIDQPGTFDPFAGSGGYGSPPGSETFLRLPAETAQEALDRIFRVWVTEVRPRIPPDLSDPSNAVGGTPFESAVLLSCFDLAPAVPFSSSNPEITSFGPADDTGRPFLLHTQLIQELRILHDGELGSEPQREFASLQMETAHRVLAWIHHPTGLTLAPNAALALKMTADGQPMTISSWKPVPGFPNVFAITTTNQIAPGARVEVRLPLGAMLTSTNATLLSVLDSLDYSYVGRDGETIVAYGFARRPVREFATVKTTPPGLSIWLHNDQPLNLKPKDAVTLYRALARNRTPITLKATGGSSDYSSEWELTLAQALEPLPGPRPGFPLPPPETIPPFRPIQPLKDGELVELVFDADHVLVSQTQSLSSFMQEKRLDFLGYDGDHSIHVFYVVSIPPQIQPGPSIDEIIKKVMAMPALPFVTITPVGVGQKIANFEVWFHPNLDPADNKVYVIPTEETLPVYAEIDDQETNDGPLALTLSSTVVRNVFKASIDKTEWQAVASKIGSEQPVGYLRFAFPRALILSDRSDGTNRFTLEQYIDEKQIKFEGDDGKKYIVAYVRVPISQR